MKSLVRGGIERTVMNIAIELYYEGWECIIVAGPHGDMGAEIEKKRW